MAKAASPSSTFCDDLTMMAVRAASSPSMVPDAATAPVVSIVPPSHAPATSPPSPMSSASHGIRYIIGTAQTSTSEMMYESLRLSPRITPLVAIAAETPQIDTALDSIVDISLSTPSRREIQNAKYHTATTTTSACPSP